MMEIHQIRRKFNKKKIELNDRLGGRQVMSGELVVN